MVQQRRRQMLQGAAALALAGGVHPAFAKGDDGAKVLRYAFPIAETGFDPTQILDLYSRTVCAHIFEAKKRAHARSPR